MSTAVVSDGHAPIALVHGFLGLCVSLLHNYRMIPVVKFSVFVGLLHLAVKSFYIL